MDWKGREGTYNFFSHDDWRQPGAGNRAQGAAAPATLLKPPMLEDKVPRVQRSLTEVIQTHNVCVTTNPPDPKSDADRTFTTTFTTRTTAIVSI